VYAPGWPSTEHTILVGREKNVWLAGAGAGDCYVDPQTMGKSISGSGLRGPTMAPEQNNQQKQDKFFVAHTTLDRESAGSINFSVDPKQEVPFCFRHQEQCGLDC
jgi:hypothetical protein